MKIAVSEIGGKLIETTAVIATTIIIKLIVVLMATVIVKII